MEGDLGLPPESHFLEKELPAIPNAGQSPRYPGLNKQWWLYPVIVSLTDGGWAALERRTVRSMVDLDRNRARCQEPNIRAILRFLQANPAPLGPPPGSPRWSARLPMGGVAPGGDGWCAGRTFGASSGQGSRLQPARGRSLPALSAAGPGLHLELFHAAGQAGCACAWPAGGGDLRRDRRPPATLAQADEPARRARLAPHVLGPGDWAEVSRSPVTWPCG